MSRDEHPNTRAPDWRPTSETVQLGGRLNYAQPRAETSLL
jgi:hypothetical protein